MSPTIFSIRVHKHLPASVASRLARSAEKDKEGQEWLKTHKHVEENEEQ